MKQLNIPADEKQIIYKFRNQLKNALGQNLISVQLFGSKARGDWQKKSDIDILVLVKEKKPQLKNKIYEIAFNLLLERNIYLSVKIFDLKEFQKLNKIPTVFMQAIKNEAIEI